MLELRSPMLAPNKIPNLEDLQYPLYASIKMDGIRCLIINGDLYSRSGKLIPNKNLREVPQIKCLMNFAREGFVLDGELWTEAYSFQTISSLVMSQDSPLDQGDMLKLHVFDCLTHDEWRRCDSAPYCTRMDRLGGFSEWKVDQIPVGNPEKLSALYDKVLSEGHEGLIIRKITGPYKWGRCTLKEGNMYKLKATDELDCIIIGYSEKEVMTDDATRETDNLGRLKSVHRQSDRRGAEVLGSLRVRDETGREFSVGSGFSEQDRHNLWSIGPGLIGKWIKVKSASAGVKDLPRHPVFKGFRDEK